MEYITRSVEKAFLKKSRTHKVVLLVGAEEVGRITMLKHLSEGEGRCHVSLDDLHPRTLAETDSSLFFELFKPPLIIEAIDFVPKLIDVLKVMCDEKEEIGLFWLTCTPKADFIEYAKNILGSRLAVLEMYGLSVREEKGMFCDGPLDFSWSVMDARARISPGKNLTDTFRHIWRGGMPKMNQVTPEEKRKKFWHYFHEELLYQVAQSKRVNEITRFSDFLTACALCITEVLSVQKLAMMSGISSPTAKKWMKLLVDLGIIYLLKPYENDEFLRLIKAPKLYFTDTGLCSYISNWKTPEELMKGGESSAYFENFVVMELVKSFANRDDGAELRFFRDCFRREIDILILQEGRIHPFEIRKTAAPEKTEIKKFSVFEGKPVLRGSGGIICPCREVERIDENNFYLPYNIL